VGSGKGLVGAEGRGWKDRTDGAGMANGAEESGLCGGENGAHSPGRLGPRRAPAPCQGAHRAKRTADTNHDRRKQRPPRLSPTAVYPGRRRVTSQL
jgi:hypothetical protein